MTYQDIINNLEKNIKFILYKDGNKYFSSSKDKLYFSHRNDEKIITLISVPIENSGIVIILDQLILPNDLNTSINYKIKAIEYENTVGDTLDNLLKILNNV